MVVTRSDEVIEIDRNEHAARGGFLYRASHGRSVSLPHLTTSRQIAPGKRDLPAVRSPLVDAADLERAVGTVSDYVKAGRTSGRDGTLQTARVKGRARLRRTHAPSPCGEASMS